MSKENCIVAYLYIEAGAVQLLKGAPWINDFRTEFVSFSYGRHDDQIDVLSQLLHWISHNFSIVDVIYSRFKEFLWLA